MKPSFYSLVAAIYALIALSGCTTSTTLGSMSTTQAIALSTPIVSGGVALVLRNNPKYLTIAQTVGTDLASSDFKDLTTVGVSAAVTAAVTKAGGDAAISSILSATVTAGLATYLEAVGESALAKDPFAQTVLQDLGGAISAGAALAAANPK